MSSAARRASGATNSANNSLARVSRHWSRDSGREVQKRCSNLPPFCRRRSSAPSPSPQSQSQSPSQPRRRRAINVPSTCDVRWFGAYLRSGAPVRATTRVMCQSVEASDGLDPIYLSARRAFVVNLATLQRSFVRARASVGFSRAHTAKRAQVNAVQKNAPKLFSVRTFALSHTHTQVKILCQCVRVFG